MIDRHVILSVVYMVGIIALVLVGGIVFSSVTGRTIDNGVSTLAGTALGYLGGILTNVSRAKERSEQPADTATMTVPSKPDVSATMEVHQEPQTQIPG